MNLQIGDHVYIKEDTNLDLDYFKRHKIDRHGIFEITRIVLSTFADDIFVLKQAFTKSEIDIYLYDYEVEAAKKEKVDLEEFM